MIRTVALEIILAVLLAYSAVSVQELRQYDPLADAAGSVSSGSRSGGDLPALAYEPTGGKDIFEKNLFHPERVGHVPPPPPPPGQKITEIAPPPPPPPPPEPMPQVALKGILEDNSGERIALISMNNERARSYRVGDMFDKFEVVEIGILDVKLTWKGESVPLKLRGAAVPERGSTPPAPASHRGR